MFIEKKLTINNDKFNENMYFLINGKFNYLANLLADENDISIKVVRFDGLDKRKIDYQNTRYLRVSMKHFDQNAKNCFIP